MKCPTCKEVNLVMSERKGVEIDYCPECRGIWLDRGELDKIIDKATIAESTSKPDFNASYDNDYRKNDTHNHPHKKKNWLSDLFD